VFAVIISGCGGGETQSDNAEKATSSNSDGTDRAPVAATKPLEFGPLELGGSNNGETTSVAGEKDAEGGLDAVMDRMKPLQILLGQWRGITRKEQALVPQQWVWDLKTDPAQPALVLKSAESPYFREGRLTWLAREKTFQFSGTTGKGKREVLRGVFSQPPRQVAGDADDQPQMTFKLELTQVDETAPATSWKLVFNQQENNRMLVELSRRRGQGMFRLQDTIGCQREGTSFALSDTDYGEKTCVISQGLGTTAVSYKGKTYWVCCSGCKAAFEEEPEKWIARFEAMKAKKSSP
jgi:ribosomal protein L24E